MSALRLQSFLIKKVRLWLRAPRLDALERPYLRIQAGLFWLDIQVDQGRWIAGQPGLPEQRVSDWLCLRRVSKWCSTDRLQDILQDILEHPHYFQYCQNCQQYKPNGLMLNPVCCCDCSESDAGS